MRHPHRLLRCQVAEERAFVRTKLRLAELACAPVDLPAEALRHQVHAVADAECRHAELEDGRIDLRRAVCVDRGRPAGEDQRDGIATAQLVGGGAMRDELRVDARLAHATCD